VLEEPTETLEELAAQSATGKVTGSALVRRFIRAGLREWERRSACEKRGTREEAPKWSTLKPVVDLVEMRAPGDPDATKVETTCRQSLAREYMSAEHTYLQLTIGSSKWPIGGESFISSDGPRSSNRIWGQKTRKVDVTPSLLDDGAQRAAIQSFKRLLTFVHRIWEDTAK